MAETVSDIRWALGTLAARFRRVVWAPGNHELWTHPKDPVTLRGAARYAHLVEVCRELGVTTPEDPYPVWEGAGGPVAVAPLFLLYDYSFLPAGCATKEEGLAYAHGTGVVCNDEYLLHPDPYPSREAWCRRASPRPNAGSPRCRTACPPSSSTTTRWTGTPPTSCGTRVRHVCGTRLTADWHRRFRVDTMVYGHLHIPRTTWHEGVRFEEVSVGYPREWRKRSGPPGRLRRILPAPARREQEAGPVIEELLPDTVVTVEAHGNDDAGHLPLHPEEEPLVARAVAKRRREFTVVRSCARRAMEKLGVPAQPVLNGERGAPDLARGADRQHDPLRRLLRRRPGPRHRPGVPRYRRGTRRPLPDGVLPSVSLPAEAERLRRLGREHPGVHWERLLFSAKESVYKAWFPLTGRWLDFTEADIEILVDPDDPRRGTLRAELLVPGPTVSGRACTGSTGAGSPGTVWSPVPSPSRTPDPVGRPRADRSGAGAPASQQPEERLLVPRESRLPQRLVGLGEHRGRDHGGTGGTRRSRRGVELGPYRVQEPQIRLDGRALVIGQYGGGHRSALPQRRQRSAPPHGGGTPPACRPPLTMAVAHARPAQESGRLTLSRSMSSHSATLSRCWSVGSWAARQAIPRTPWSWSSRSSGSSAAAAAAPGRRAAGAAPARCAAGRPPAPPGPRRSGTRRAP